VISAVAQQSSSAAVPCDQPMNEGPAASRFRYSCMREAFTMARIASLLFYLIIAEGRSKSVGLQLE
jgi:hypothetical protein